MLSGLDLAGMLRILKFFKIGVKGLADYDTEGIIQALGKALRLEFGKDTAVYDEEVKQGAATPCFFIGCFESRESRYLGSRYFRENKFLIQYYPKSSNRKKRECDEVSQRLFDCLLWIGDKDNELLMGRKMSSRYEKGVLSFFVNYDMFLIRQEEATLMGELSYHGVSQRLKGE